MTMKKTLIKEVLLKKYFEVKEGIELEEFLEKIEETRNVWQEFHHILRNQIKYFYKQEIVKGIKTIVRENQSYLFIRLHAWDYLLINIETKQVVNKEKAKTLFNQAFFIENFSEEEQKYLFLNTCQNPEVIVNFYLENENILKQLPYFFYSIGNVEANSYMYVDFVEKNSHIGFFADKEGLKEQFFWEIQPNKELEDKIMKIKIPYDLIPKEMLEEPVRRTKSVPR